MYDELCRHCGAKESLHDVRHDYELDLDHDLTDEERATQLAKRFAGEGVPCEVFESEVDHLPGCPVVIDYPHNGNMVEVYCQQLPGKCQQLMDINSGLTELPE